MIWGSFHDKYTCFGVLGTPNDPIWDTPQTTLWHFGGPIWDPFWRVPPIILMVIGHIPKRGVQKGDPKIPLNPEMAQNPEIGDLG